jgi:hypothetical protein
LRSIVKIIDKTKPSPFFPPDTIIYVHCRSLLLAEDSPLEDTSIVVSRKDRIEQIISLRPLGLRHLVRGPLESDKDDPGVKLLEAGVLALREPGIAA